MKRLMIICILIINIIFISGCTSEDKTNSGTTNNLQSSGYLINPSILSNDYSSSQYQTRATSEMNTFDGPFNNYAIGEPYEGDIPDGKKRVLTFFRLSNKDTNIRMDIKIFEPDSDSKFKELFPEPETSMVYPVKREVTSNSVLTEQTIYRDDNFIGDYSFMISTESVRKTDGKILGSNAILRFTHKKLYIDIQTQCSDMGSEICQKETMKVAKAIKNQLD